MLSVQQILPMVTGILGGLALFLFGMNTLSAFLTQLAGGRLETVIGKVTATRFSGWLFGFGATAIIQSSSATTVMIVGLVNSGIMKLSQAVNMVIGANLGTTATAWILSLNGIQGESFLMNLLKPSTLMPFLALAGVALQMFSSSERKKLIGSVLIGFGILMMGMTMMSSAVAPLKDIPQFKNALLNFSSPAIGFLVAILFTLVIQSSDATVGILQALAMSVGVNFRMAVVIVCGAQIGTCITAIISSVGSGNNGKRAALIHLYYNLIKNVPFIIVLLILDRMMTLSFMASPISAVGIAVFHSSINLVFSIIMVPISGVLVRLAVKTVPYSEAEKREQEDTLTYLDPILLRTPSLAIVQAGKAVNAVSESVQNALDAVLDGNEAQASLCCEQAARYIRQTETYSAGIIQKRLLSEESREIQFLQQVCDELSVIAQQITSLIANRGTEEVLGASAAADLKVYGGAVRETLSVVADGFAVRSSKLADTVRIFHEVIDGLAAEVGSRQTRRVHRGEISYEANLPFTEICFAYKRILDRCDSIAGKLMVFENSLSNHISSEEQLAWEEKQKEIGELFQDKYSLLK